jgi:Flp pilus assembly protein TadD
VVRSIVAARSGEVPLGTERARLVRHTRAAGVAALPALMRALGSDHEIEAGWAYYLLGQLGGDRVVQRVSALLGEADVNDEVKARCLGLLSDLGAPVPADVSLHDPDGLLQRSVRELLDGLDRPSEVREAVDLILLQVPVAELASFAAEVMRHGGRRAAPLLGELAERPGLDAPLRERLAALAREAAASRHRRRVSEALDRGLAYLEAGRPRAARRRLERYVATMPACAEGRSALGVCLLQLDENEAALRQFQEAARLEPDEALHHWNLAAAAKQVERLGGAYLALRDYLGRSDDNERAAERREEARGFVKAYERMLREAHPGVTLTDYLRGEEMFARAYAALTEGRDAEAVDGFRAVLELVPRHYPSWSNLGAALLALGERDEARRCLERALQLNPDYAVARKNLALLDA